MFIGRTPSYLSFGVKMYLMMGIMQAYVRSGEDVPCGLRQSLELEAWIHELDKLLACEALETISHVSHTRFGRRYCLQVPL
jgi:hypothetical protein